jgi:membrane-associated phospholipid phosphatase
MNKLIAGILACMVMQESVKAQDTLSSSSPAKPGTPYKIFPWADAAVIAGGVGWNALGYYLIQKKANLTPDELSATTVESVPFFDRSSAGWYDKEADDLSYYPFQASFAIPVVAGLIDRNQRHHFGQVLVLYTESMALIGGIYTLSAGAVERPRPFVYGGGVPLRDRLSRHNQRSFMSGHTASTAAAMFLTAKIFHDMNPGSSLRPYMWGGAAAVSVWMGYLRYKAGMHFLSDNLVGLAFGTAVGILVPEVHKKKYFDNRLSVNPGISQESALSVTWQIR